MRYHNNLTLSTCTLFVLNNIISLVPVMQENGGLELSFINTSWGHASCGSLNAVCGDIMTARLRTQTSKSRGRPLLPVKADYILYH